LPVVDAMTGRERRAVLALWVAAAAVAVAGVLPFVLGGTSSRLNIVILPFAFGAIAIAATALLHTQSRTVISIVYFVAGLSIVYGLMSMFSFPVMLTALGACPAAPEPCTNGLPRALTEGETAGLGAATTVSVVGLIVGFYGLFVLYRRKAPQPAMPPAARKIPPVVQAPVAASVATPEAEPELPAPEEVPELPAHESSTASS
jgi:hypothetical protein